MTRIRRVAAQGTLTSDSSGADTSLTSAEFADLPVVDGGDVLALVLDPQRLDGDPEVVYVTDHASSSTTVTVTRGEETSAGGSTARTHVTGTAWVNGPLPSDFAGTSGSEELAAVYGYGPFQGSTAVFIDVYTMHVEFEGPASGNVEVHLEAQVDMPADEFCTWRLFSVDDLDTVPAGNPDGLLVLSTYTTHLPTTQVVSESRIITGLTPGQLYRWKWQHSGSVQLTSAVMVVDALPVATDSATDSYFAEVMADGPYPFYPMQESDSSSTMSDGSGGDADGTYLAYGPSDPTPLGAYNRAHTFPGSPTSGAQAPSVDLTGETAITIEFWLRSDDNTGTPVVFELGALWTGGNGFRMLMQESGGSVSKVGMSAGASVQDRSFPARHDNDWHFYSFTFDRASNAITARIDGVAETLTNVSTDDVSGSPEFDLADLNLMARDNGASNFATGAMFGFAIFDGILSNTRRDVHANVASG